VADLSLLLEAETRGLLPADKQGLLDEARTRGLVPQREGFETTPGGAAMGNPQAAAKYGGPKQQRGADALTSIGGAGALGAGAGLFGPQILQGASTLAQGIPALRPISGALNFMSQGAKAAGPALRTIAGGVSGLASESAGQVAEQVGANVPTAEAARLVGGAVTPELGPLAAMVGRFTVSGGPQQAAISYAKSLLSKLSNNSITPAEKQRLATIQQQIMGEQDPGKAMALLGQHMEEGALGVRSSSAAQAEALHTQARSVADSAKRAADAELAALPGRRANVDSQQAYLKSLQEQSRTAGESTVAAIGQNRPLYAIGGDLQAAAAAKETALRTAASTQYKETADEVAKIVAQREGAGESVTALPAYRNIVASLESELKPGVHSKDVAAAYQKILDQIKSSAGGEIQPQFKVGPSGDLVYSELPGAAPVGPSFQAVDDARRMLGEAFRGQADEGYKAIGQTAQKKYYGLLSQSQKDFAGEPQATLLTQYADSRPGLEIFGSKAGTKLTGLDKGALTQFASDPSKIPSYFFSTPKTYNALVDLVGDKDLALQAAQQFAANSLASVKTAKQVGNWMTTNREFLNAVPEVRSSVIAYQNSLQKSEQAVGEIGLKIKQLGTQKNALAPEAKTTANALLAEGKAGAALASTEAKKVTTEGAALADKIWNDSAGALKNVRDAIEGGDITRWAAIAPVIERSPDAKKAVFDAVRQVAAEMGSSKAAIQKFNEQMRPALEKFGMLGAEDANFIAKKMAEYGAQPISEVEKLGLMRRLILQGVMGYSGSLGGRVGAAGFSLASDIPTKSPTNALAPRPVNQLGNQ
jgi:hypothetical protein